MRSFLGEALVKLTELPEMRTLVLPTVAAVAKHMRAILTLVWFITSVYTEVTLQIA